MLDVRKQQKARPEADKETLNGQIAATGRLTDAHVYELCGLTEKEARILEGDT
jgi:hypothetical protein